MRWTALFDHDLSSYEVTFDSDSVIAWVNADERLIIDWSHRPILEIAIQDRIISVPWEGDGRFLCFRYHWARTGFANCPVCNCPVKYKYRVTHDYMTQTWKRIIIPQSLEAHGIYITVDQEAVRSWSRHEYMEARIKRQGRASAN
eukprot:1152435-Pyramimonas_sp.AAC.1